MSKQKSFLIFLSLFLGGYSFSQNTNKYQQVIDNAHNNGLPAIVASVQSGSNQWQGKAGFSNLEQSIPLDISQPFRLASITKIFTAVIVLQLIDEEKLTLTTPIAKYLDAATIKKVPYADKITIDQLLSHSSGIYSFTENNSFWKECFFNEGMSRTWKPTELINYIENKKPTHQPVAPYTEKYYSNTNAILLGMVIENITGNTLLDSYQKRIFTPLNMTHSFLEGYDNKSHQPIDSYAIPNTYFLKSAKNKKDIKNVKKSEYINLSSEYKLFNSWAWAAGGISSNLNDLSIFLSALRKGELLSKESQMVLLKLNSSVDKGITFFGGTGGGDGIEATMLHLMPADVSIIILVNSTGHKEVNLSTVFKELYKVSETNK